MRAEARSRRAAGRFPWIRMVREFQSRWRIPAPPTVRWPDGGGTTFWAALCHTSHAVRLPTTTRYAPTTASQPSPSRTGGRRRVQALRPSHPRHPDPATSVRCGDVSGTTRLVRRTTVPSTQALRRFGRDRHPSPRLRPFAPRLEGRKHALAARSAAIAWGAPSGCPPRGGGVGLRPFPRVAAR